MQHPFFSILLPTKNRSEILPGAIESALNQTFGDFELIISDNDDSSTATAQAVARFQDPRIRYFRTTGKLAMYDNWENALSHATGEHVLVLEDKMRLVLNALEVLHGLLRKHGNVVISYDIKFARGESSPGPNGILKPKVSKSSEVIESFCRFSQRSFNVLPKALDSCAPREVVEEAKRRSPTGYFFSHLTPDYSAAFQLLSTVDEFLCVREPLAYVPNNWMWQGQYSTGQASYNKTASYQGFLESLPVEVNQILAGVPIKSEFLWINLVLYDFRKLYQRHDHDPQIDWRRYYAFCIILILMGRRVGGDLKAEIALLRAGLRQQSLAFKAIVAYDFLERSAELVVQMIRGRIK